MRKKIAKRAYDAALAREYAALLKTLKDRAAGAESPEDIWAISEYLKAQEKAIGWKYDYRYSKLLSVFGRLVKEGWISAEDLAGLSEEKRGIIDYLAEN
ncbi:MAG: hypothetical protein ACKN9T_00210 [Candidatus Methylumidiphilus sp.]